MVAPTRPLPASGYVLEVDGQFKTEYARRDGALAGAGAQEAQFHAPDQNLRRDAEGQSGSPASKG